VLGEHLDGALGRAVTKVDDRDGPPVGEPRADVADHCLHVAAVGVGGLSGHDQVAVLIPRVEAKRAQRPPGPAATQRGGADLPQLLVRRGAEVDRALPATRRGRPARPEELLGSRDQIVCPRTRTLRVEHQDRRVGGEQVDQQLHLVDERGGQRLHALDRDAFGELLGELLELRVRLAERAGPLANLGSQQQLAARRGP
jgi:hypothetical protein